MNMFKIVLVGISFLISQTTFACLITSGSATANIISNPSSADEKISAVWSWSGAESFIKPVSV